MATNTEVSPVRRFFIARVFPWAIVLVGAGAITIGLENTWRARASVDWPAVHGTVARSAVERVSSSSTSGSRSGRSVSYVAQVVYEYEAEGSRRTGNRISYGHYDTEDEADAARVVAKYPAGGSVTVRYLPGSPGESVLEPGSYGLPWLYLGLGIAFLLVGCALVVLAPKLAARAK